LVDGVDRQKEVALERRSRLEIFEWFLVDIRQIEQLNEIHSSFPRLAFWNENSLTLGYLFANMKLQLIR
jgi:hypothetical protein